MARRWVVLSVFALGCSSGQEVATEDAVVVEPEVGAIDSSVESGVDANTPDTYVADTAPEVVDSGPPPLWVPTGGPWAQAYATAVAIDGPNWVVTTPTGFVFRSRDDGANFEPWPDELARRTWGGSAAHGVAISRGQVIISGAAGVFAAPLGGGPFKRVAAPWTWSSTTTTGYDFLAATASGAWITTTSFDIDGRGVYRRSTDGGATWSANYWNGRSHFVRAEGETVLLGEEKTGVLRMSNDGGATFVGIETNGPSVQDAVVSKTHVVVAAGNALRSRNLATGIWRNVESFSPSWDPVYRSLARDGDVIAAIAPLGSRRSTDGGATWNELKVYLTAMSPAAVAPGVMAVATRGDGVQRSLDRGLTWSPRGRGVQATALYALAAPSDAPGTLYALTNGFMLLKSVNSGADWTRLEGGGTGVVVCGKTLLVAGYGAVTRSVDGGATRELGVDTTAGWPAIVAGGSTVIVNHFKGYARSTDCGATWVTYTSPILDRRLATNASGSLFLAIVADGVMRSTDSGLTWLRSSTTLGRTDDIAVAPDGTAFALLPNGDLFRSTDAGDTWSRVVGLGERSALLNSLGRLGFTPAGELLVSGRRETENGDLFVLWRLRADDSLERFDEGLWTPGVHAYALSGGALFAATESGVYRLTR